MRMTCEDWGPFLPLTSVERLQAGADGAWWSQASASWPVKWVPAPFLLIFHQSSFDKSGCKGDHMYFWTMTFNERNFDLLIVFIPLSLIIVCNWGNKILENINATL